MTSPRAGIKLKLFLIGDNDVGKSAWLNCMLGKSVSSSQESALVAGWDLGRIDKIYFRDINMSPVFVCTNASAEARYEKIIDQHMAAHQDAYLVFYNLANKQSFENVDRYIERIKRRNQNPDASFLLIGIHFGGAISVTEEAAAVKARKYRLQSYYGVNPKYEMEFTRLKEPLHYIIQRAPSVKLTVPTLNFNRCIKEIDRALRLCWDDERAAELYELKRMLANFECFGDQVTQFQFSEMQRECQALIDKAQIILEGAFPERIKIAVFAAATTALLATALVCGLALLNVFTLPVLTGVLIAGCVLGGAAGVATFGCTIFKIKENIIYSSMVDAVELATKGFPKME